MSLPPPFAPALFAGIVASTSPYCLPLMPGYIRSVMIVIGLLMVTGQWTLLFSPLVRWFSQSGWPPI